MGVSCNEAGSELVGPLGTTLVLVGAGKSELVPVGGKYSRKYLEKLPSVPNAKTIQPEEAFDSESPESSESGKSRSNRVSKSCKVVAMADIEVGMRDGFSEEA